ncbi:MAG: radical SAM/SPASM domain-containing protein [Planctomycetota bacterium]|jgi:spiro-SPASM protein
MTAAVCLPVDLRENSVGLPSLLEEEIDGAPVLYHTVSRLTLSSDYKVVILLAEGETARDDAERVRTLIGGLECEIMTTGAGDVVNRPFLRRGRLWSLNSWRGGMGWTTYWDEAGSPAALAEAAEKLDADAVGLLTGDSPYADPSLASQLLAWHRERLRKAQVTVTGVPPGLAPAFFSREVIKAYAKQELTLAASVAYNPTRAQRDIASTEAHFEADMGLRTAPWRFTAHSLRQLEMMRALCDLGASVRKASGLDAVVALGGHPELWSGPVPAKIEIEPTTRFDAAPFYLRDYACSRVSSDMPPDVFANIVSSLAPHRDVCLSLEGLGEPLLHEHLVAMVTAAREAGILGVHIATGGRFLDLSAFRALRDAGLDILSVNVGAAGEDAYQRLFGCEAFAKVAAAVEEVFAERRKSDITWPLIVAEITKLRALDAEVEPFYNHWLGRCDWPVIRPFNDFAGQVEDAATVHMRTSARIPCRRIFNEMFIDAEGTAWPCRQDIHRTRPLGNAAEEGIPALWHCGFMEELREAHSRGDWGFWPLCLACKDWYYTI